MSLLNRRKGQLVRNVNGLHGIIVESDRRTNTACIFLALPQHEETFSWWDLKQPNDETALAFGVKNLAHWAEHHALRALVAVSKTPLAVTSAVRTSLS